MYRIHFDPKTALWVVQFCRFGFFWITVQGYRATEPMPQDANGMPESLSGKTYGPLQFEKLEDAEGFVKERGIDKAYKRQTATFYTMILNGGQPEQFQGYQPVRGMSGIPSMPPSAV